MPLSKSKGNMYPWVTHTHTHLGGKCYHECKYCYVQAMRNRFGTDRYAGPVRKFSDEYKVDYGSDRVIFIEHCNDMWEDHIPAHWINEILSHCCRYPDNTYVFQTKNPQRYTKFLDKLPPDRMLGCTIETDNAQIASLYSKAPAPNIRYAYMHQLKEHYCESTFITIEPILMCDPLTLATMVSSAGPDFVNIGADSKDSGLHEPMKAELTKVLDLLKSMGVTIKQKSNLDRLLKDVKA